MLPPDLLAGVGTVSGFAVALGFGLGAELALVAVLFIGLSFGGGVV